MKIKSKDIIFAETRECSAQYGVSNGDIMTCPMGVEIEIVGMGKVDLRLYAKFPGNIISPLQPSNREELQQSEYKPKELEQILRKQQAMKSKISGRSCDLLATTCRFDDSTLSSAEMVKRFFLKEWESGAITKAREEKLKAAAKKGKKGKKGKKSK